MTSSAAAIAVALLLLATPGMAQTGPAPYSVTEIKDGDAPACSLRGPDGAAWQLEFVWHKDDRIFVALVSPVWRLGAASHGKVTVHSGTATMTKEFRSVSPTRMTAELDWDAIVDINFIQNLAGTAVVDVSFPSGNSVHIPGPTQSSAAALDQCARDQKQEATPTAAPGPVPVPAR